MVVLHCEYNPGWYWNCDNTIFLEYRAGPKMEPVSSVQVEQTFSSDIGMNSFSLLEFNLCPESVKDELKFQMTVEFTEYCKESAKIDKLPEPVLVKIFKYSQSSRKTLSLVSKTWKTLIERNFIFTSCRVFQEISLTSEHTLLIENCQRQFSEINAIVHDESWRRLELLKVFAGKNRIVLETLRLHLQGWRMFNISFLYEILKEFQWIRKLEIVESPYTSVSRCHRDVPDLRLPNLENLKLTMRELDVLGILTLPALKHLTLGKSKSIVQNNCTEMFDLEWSQGKMRVENFCTHTPISQSLIRVLEPLMGELKSLVLMKSLFPESFCPVIFEKTKQLEYLETDLGIENLIFKNYQSAQVKKLVIRDVVVTKANVLKLKEMFPNINELVIVTSHAVTNAYQNMILRSFVKLKRLIIK